MTINKMGQKLRVKKKNIWKLDGLNKYVCINCYGKGCHLIFTKQGWSCSSQTWWCWRHDYFCRWVSINNGDSHPIQDLYYFSMEFLVEMFSSAFFATCFLFLELRLLVRGFAVRFSMLFSWLLTNFSTVGSSGGASGHGVRFAGTVTSSGGSIIHLHRYREVWVLVAVKNMIANNCNFCFFTVLVTGWMLCIQTYNTLNHKIRV